jgi:hypothetical protein
VFAVPWTNPIPGQADQVILAEVPMELVPGKYSVEEADRFGEKVSQGTLKYADFNPYESAHAVATLSGGAGLRRYSDAGDDPTQFATLYKESQNINCCFAPAVLSPEVTYEPLPGATGPAVWMGEDWVFQAASITKRFLAVGPSSGGTTIWERSDTGPWSVFLSIPGAAPRENAIGLFFNTLIIGFGGLQLAASVGEGGVIGQVTQIDGQPLYVWAYTSDRASSFVAGGPTTGDFHLVTSSINAATGYSNAGDAGSVDTGDMAINSLAPGGGLVLVYVGRVDELGMIDITAGEYHSLLPFDSKYETNCSPMKWVLASGSDQSRGSVTLVFPRERSLWEYTPSDQFTGTASNVSPWAQDFRRPPNARGVVTAIQGTARWLYYAVQNGAGETWIYRNDQTTGAPHTYLFLGTTTVDFLAVTSIFPGNPLLLFSSDNQVGQVVLPLDGDSEIDDPNCRYQLQGYVDIPDIDLGFPDEDKIGFEVRVISDNLSALSRYHDVQIAEDGGPWTDLGNIITSPSQGVNFPLQNKAKRISLRIWFFTDDNTQSPQMWGFSVRLSLNTKVYRLFVFQARLPATSFSTLADDLQDPYAIITNFWNLRAAGYPIDFLDPWNDDFQVRLIKLQQQQALREPDHSPEWVMDFTLLEFLPGQPATTGFVYDMDWTLDPAGNPDQAALYGYDMPLAVYDASTPVP